MFTVSRWNVDRERWEQVNPPESATEAAITEQRDAESAAVETQTIVCSAGKSLQASLEEGMNDLAKQLGVECETIEHPHLLTTQIAFKVTGPRYKIEQFREGLVGDTQRSIRMDGFGTGII